MQTIMIINTNNVNKINSNKLEVVMGHLGLHGQMAFKGFESLANQNNEQINPKQKSISKISKIGRKLPGIKKTEYFKFNNKVDFTIQRQSLKRMGASEVGSIFIGEDSVTNFITSRVLKTIGKELPFQDNLSMRKGKVLENLAFDEFLRIYSDNIQVLHKNKYANGIDKYNYFKKINGEGTLVASTIDGWFVNAQGEAELLEIKCSDNINLRSVIIEYNRTGNFLDNRYFFKYYVQVQIQLACTGLSKGNLFFLIGNEAINCVVMRNDAFITKVMTFVKALGKEVTRICTLLRSKTDIETASLDDLSEHIKNMLACSEVYQSLSKLNYKFEFIEFVNYTNLDMDKEKSLRLMERLMTIKHLQLNMEQIEKHYALDVAKVTKPMKDRIKSYMDAICKEYSLLEHVNYKFKSNLFVIDTTKRAIKDRVRCLTDTHFSFSNLNNVYTPVNLAAV